MWLSLSLPVGLGSASAASVFLIGGRALPAARRPSSQYTASSYHILGSAEAAPCRESGCDRVTDGRSEKISSSIKPVSGSQPPVTALVLCLSRSFTSPSLLDPPPTAAASGPSRRPPALPPAEAARRPPQSCPPPWRSPAPATMRRVISPSPRHGSACTIPCNIRSHLCCMAPVVRH